MWMEDTYQGNVQSSAGFFIDLLEKSAGKIVNGDHMFMGHLGSGNKCEWVVKFLDVIVGLLGQLEL